MTFQSRVTFSDRDMAGTAVIRSGGKSVHISFSTPYALIPKVVVTADTFARYRVTAKTGNGFIIETESPVTEDTSFDWIALAIDGANTAISLVDAETLPDDTSTPEEIISPPETSLSGSEIGTTPSPETTSDTTLAPEEIPSSTGSDALESIEAPTLPEDTTESLPSEEILPVEPTPEVTPPTEEPTPESTPVVSETPISETAS